MECHMNKVKNLAVITGGNSGIGACIAECLAEEGWDIAISDIGMSDNICKNFHGKLRDKGADVFFQLTDVKDKEAVDSFYENIFTHFGRAPDLLVNNAGTQTWAPLLELEEKDWDNVIGTNLKGCFLNTQAVARAMTKEKKSGSIINIGSGSNSNPFPNLVDYTASKGGVEMLTKVAAVELGTHNIRVNCVAPGGILIERTKQEADDYERDWASIAPLGRVGYPTDIAEAIKFLASENASFITGQTLYVDGGVNTKANWPYERK